MKILIVDCNTEAQAQCARKLDSFPASEIESLNIQLKLVSDKDYVEKIFEADVLVFGAGLGDHAVALARTARSLSPSVHMLMFVSDAQYSRANFRAAQLAGIRKVLSNSSSPLDFLQELMAIHEEFRRDGKAREGKVVLVTSAKGGAGVTSIVAGLAEVCAENGRKVMAWDLDIDTGDLSRSLSLPREASLHITNWVNGSAEITRESFEEALFPIGENASVLLPPKNLAESFDLVCHTDGIGIAQRVCELARMSNDVVLIDAGGRLGPAVGALMRLADVILVVVGDSILGLSAVDALLVQIRTLVGDTDKLAFFCSRAELGVQEIAAELERSHKLGSAPWRLPALALDPKGALWAGSGKTFYSTGSKQTRATFQAVARDLGLADIKMQGELLELTQGPAHTRWFSRDLFSKLRRKPTAAITESPDDTTPPGPQVANG